MSFFVSFTIQFYRGSCMSQFGLSDSWNRNTILFLLFMYVLYFLSLCLCSLNKLIMMIVFMIIHC